MIPRKNLTQNSPTSIKYNPLFINVTRIAPSIVPKTVTLPPDLLVRLGGAGRYTVGNINSGYISLQGESVEAMGKMVLASICPACKHDYKDSDEQLCPSCGSSRPMVEA